MANRATRCPHCQTSFRVTESQLATARGRVRCGACLEVFNATTNWVDPAPSQADIPEPEPRYDDNTPFPDDEAERDFEHSSAASQPAADSEPTGQIDDFSAEDNSIAGAEDTAAESEDSADNTFALDRDEEVEVSDNAGFSAVENEPDSDTLEHFSSTENDSEDADDEPAFSPVDSSDDEIPVESHHVSIAADDLEQAQPEHMGPAETQSEPEPTPEPSPAFDTPEDDDFDALVAHQRRRIQISRRQVGWTLLCLLAATCLAGQIVYTNFNSLAQSQHRNALVETCKVINWAWGSQRCVLPPPRNLARIDSLGLNIMSHPRYSNSLLVDTIILNRARFEQPFPLIELIFRNDRGNVVARRAFAPDEYLAGELQGIELMPVGQSVRINISIADPGSTAVNYEMQFLPAAES